MARVSSASTEADFAPGMIPFDWEAAPGRHAKKGLKSGFFGNTAAARRDHSVEVPSLPLPPGRRLEDGLYPPYFQPDESPALQSEVKLQSGRTSSQPRKLFNLKFPGSPKKPPSTSRMTQPFQSLSKPARDADHSFGIFNPISGHRFASNITKRMFEQFQKKQSLWRRCLPSKPESEDQRKASSYMDQNKGRRLDSIDEAYDSAVDSSLSGPSLPSSPGYGLSNWSNSEPVITKHIQSSSPGYGHCHSSNLSPVVTKHNQPSSPGHSYRHSSNSSPIATKQLLQPSSPVDGHSSNSSPIVTKQLQVVNSRFMASMLISLCPEADDCDEPHFDAEDENTGDYNDDNRISPMTVPKAKISSPKALFEALAKPSECSEIVVDPASQTVASHEEYRCICKHRAHMPAKVDLATAQVNQRKKISRSVSRSLHEELVATAKSPSEHLKSRKLVQREDSANKLDLSTAYADQRDDTDSYPVFSKASSNRELMRRREPYHSSFSWKPCTEKNSSNPEPVSEFVASDIAQEPGASGFAKEIFKVDVGEKYERQGGNRSLARDNFSAGSNSSSSSESNSQHNTVRPRPNPSSPSISKDVDSPMSKSTYGAPLSMAGFLSPPHTSSGDSEYSSSRDTPKAFARWKSTAEPSVLKKGPLQRTSERNQPPATRATVRFLSPPRKQALQVSAMMPSKIRIDDREKKLKSFSQCRIPSTARHALTNGYTQDYDEDSEYSTDSSPNNTPTSVSSSNFSSPKRASQSLSKSPPPLKFKLQRHRESPSLPDMVDQETALPGPSFKQVLLARSHSVRSSSSRVFSPQECSAISADTNLRGPDSTPRRLGQTSSSVMSKVAEWEAKAGVGSSSKSAPFREPSQRTMTRSSSTKISYKPSAR